MQKLSGEFKNTPMDAFVIATGNSQERTKPIEIKQVHRNNRVLQLNRKGFKPSIKREKSKINPGDLFWINGVKYVCKGMMSYGRYAIFQTKEKKNYVKFTNITKILRFGSFVYG